MISVPTRYQFSLRSFPISIKHTIPDLNRNMQQNIWTSQHFTASINTLNLQVGIRAFSNCQQLLKKEGEWKRQMYISLE